MNNLDKVLQTALKKNCSVFTVRKTSGGCINTTSKIETNCGSFFLKEMKTDRHDWFVAEEHGLLELQKSQTVAVPRVYASYYENSYACLLLEYIAQGKKNKHNAENLGRQLAEMHRQRSDLAYGFYEDNYIGSTRQINTQKASWKEFFMENRLSYQVKLASQSLPKTHNLFQYYQAAKVNIAKILPDTPNASLLHGDLWSGNWLVSNDSKSYLIDPAVYYGHNETDLAMTELFGGFPSSFYAAYDEVYTIDSEYNERKQIYNLYHILNHFNLFGHAYLSQACSILQHFI